MSTRHLSILLGALLLVAVALAGGFLFVAPERVEDQTVELFEAHQALLAEQAAGRIHETLRDIKVRLATSVAHQESRLSSADDRQEFEQLLGRLTHSSDREMGITLVVRDRSGQVLAVDPSASEEREKTLRSHKHASTVPSQDAVVSACRRCLSSFEGVSVTVAAGNERVLSANIELDKLANHIFEQIKRSRSSYVALRNDAGDVLYATGQRSHRESDARWVVGTAQIPDTPWHVEVSAPRAAIAPEVRDRVSGLLYGAYAVVGVLLAGIGTLIVLKLREHRDHLERVRSLAHQDKLATLGLLAASTAHEIRNAISVATLHLELAAEQSDGELRERVETASRSVDRLGELAESLSGYAGKDSEAVQIFDASAAVDEALKVVEPKLRGDATVEHAGEPKLGVVGSRSAIVQVVVNLVLNALDAAEEADRARVDVRTEKDGDEVVISVTDNGAGIDPQIVERIFEPFFTTKNGDGESGTGIGLWLCSQIVEQHGGTISAQNLDSSGAKFIVRLPAHPGADQDIERIDNHLTGGVGGESASA